MDVERRLFVDTSHVQTKKPRNLQNINTNSLASEWFIILENIIVLIA